MKRLKRWKVTYFLQINVSLLLLFLIPLAILGAYSYRIYAKSLEHEIGESNQEILMQTQRSIDKVITDIEDISLMLLSFPQVGLFFEREPDLSQYTDAQNIHEIVSLINVLRDSNGYIHDIYLYNNVGDILLSSNYMLMEKPTDSERDRFNSLLSSNQMQFWIQNSEQHPFFRNADSLQLIRVVRNEAASHSGMILIDIDRDRFLSAINELGIRETGYLLVLGENGRLISRPEADIYEIATSGQKPWLDSENGTTIGTYHGEELLLSYTTSQNNLWKYITVVPTAEINTNLDALIWAMATLLIFLVLSMVLVAFIIAKSFDSPFRALRSILYGQTLRISRLGKLFLNNSDMLEIQSALQDNVSKITQIEGQRNAVQSENIVLRAMAQNNSQRLRNYFVIRLIAQEVMSSAEVQQGSEEYGIPADDYYCIVLIRLSKDYQKATQEMERTDRKAIKTDLLQRTMGTYMEYRNALGFFEESKQIVVLIDFGTEQPTDGEMERIKSLSQSIQEWARLKYGFIPAILLGEAYHGLENIWKSYHDASNTLRYSYVLGSDALLLSSEIKRISRTQSLPEYQYQKFVRNSLASGEYAEIKEIVLCLREDLRGNLAAAYQYSYYYKDIISMMISHFSNEGANGLIQELTDALIGFEQKFANVDDVVEWLCGVVDRITETTQTTRLDYNAERMLRIIHSEYAAPLTLDDLSERLGLSKSYVSRLFKQQTGHNFKDYLTRCRMERARELLIGSSLNVSEIATQVGYGNADQFGRMFKQLEHMTPLEYRQKIRYTPSKDKE